MLTLAALDDVDVFAVEKRRVSCEVHPKVIFGALLHKCIADRFSSLHGFKKLQIAGTGFLVLFGTVTLGANKSDYSRMMRWLPLLALVFVWQAGILAAAALHLHQGRPLRPQPSCSPQPTPPPWGVVKPRGKRAGLLTRHPKVHAVQ